MKDLEGRVPRECPVPVESAAKVQALIDHLAGGCVSCGEALELLRENRPPAASRNDPPEFAVESAKEAFVLRELRSNPKGSALTLHPPIFDGSTRSGPPARSASALLNRQLVYHALLHTITLRVSCDRSALESIQIDGEILHRHDGPVEGVSASLHSPGAPVVTAFSGDLGHFQLVGPIHGDVRVSLLFGEHHRAEVELDWRRGGDWAFRRRENAHRVISGGPWGDSGVGKGRELAEQRREDDAFQ